jgi:hypothetical protein
MRTARCWRNVGPGERRGLAGHPVLAEGKVRVNTLTGAGRIVMVYVK